MSIHIRYLMVAFSKKNNNSFLFFLLTLRVPIHPRDGVNRNINHMATTGPCDHLVSANRG